MSEDFETLEVQVIGENPPTRATLGSVGLDLASTIDIVLEPFKTEQIPTGFRIRVPEGTYGRIAPRSCWALQNIMINGGVIDPDYRGEVKVILFYYGPGTYQIRRGDRIAQLICERAVIPTEDATIVERGERGENGFGSSGR